MLDKIKTPIAVVATMFAAQVSNGQESVYDVISEGGNTKIVTGTTANNGPTYLGSQDLSELSSESTGSIVIKRGGVTYLPTNQMSQAAPGGHSQVLGGNTFSELNTNFSTSINANAFDVSGASTVPLSGGLFPYIEHSYSGEDSSALANDNKTKTLWYEMILTSDFVNNLIEGDQVRISNRSGTYTVTGAFANGGDLLILTKTGGQLVVTQDTGYQHVTLDTDDFNMLTPNYQLTPNPVAVGGQITINGITDVFAVEGHTYVISDLSGRVIDTKKGNGPIVAPDKQGIYLVTILTGDNKKVTKKVIVE